MDRFVNRENIKRYRGLASASTDAAERLRIMKLLAEEEAKFKGGPEPRRRRSRRTIDRQHGNRELVRVTKPTAH